jgi:transcriptional regulator with XRE-family HTH domain
MSTPSFGHALGTLVRQKRQAQGLTQMQLAEDAFGTSGKTRRISELESGSVANPHPKTIDPIIATLGITSDEIEACAKRASARIEDDLDRAYREARNLIEAVARQFEHDKPSASLAELDRFLRAKATEWAVLRDRIDSIDADEMALTEIKCEAARALADGRLDEVDRLLARAEEEYQHNRTLSEVRKHAGIRISRGNGSLLKGDADTALDHYLSAVEFYRPFDEGEMAREINEIAYMVYEVSRQSLKPTFFVGASLLELLVTLPSIKADPLAMAEASYQIGLSYRNEYDDPTSLRRDDALSKAIHYSTLAMEARETQADAYKAVTSTIGLANCLRDRAKANSTVEDLQHAIGLLTSMRAKYRDDEICGALMPIVNNSLGALYRNVAAIGGGNIIADVQVKALDAFTEAVATSEKHRNIETWGASRFNVGIILMERAQADGIEAEERHFLRLRAIVEITAAIETFPAVGFPFRFADAQSVLGRLLFQHAAALQDQQLSEVYLARAVQSFDLAAEVLGVEREPHRWAHLRASQASIFALHAEWAEVSIGLNDLQRAIDYYEEAAAVFEKHGFVSEAANCREAISHAQSQRETLLKMADGDGIPSRQKNAP